MHIYIKNQIAACEKQLKDIARFMADDIINSPEVELGLLKMQMIILYDRIEELEGEAA